MPFKDPDQERRYKREYARKRRHDPEHRERILRYQREYRLNRAHTDSEYKARVQAHTRKVQQKPETKAARNIRYQTDPAHREEVLQAVRKHMTGWSPEDFSAAMTRQKGLCYICGKPPGQKGLQADHCHKTGKTRALLCVGCNTWIGAYEVDIERTRKRIAYIEFFASLQEVKPKKAQETP